MVDFTKSIRINLNMNQNELQEVVIQSLTAAPTAKKVGYIYFDSEKHKFGVCVDATAGAQKWEYMSDASDVAAKLAELEAKLKTDLTVSKIADATGIQQGSGEAATKIYFDGLVVSVEAAEDNGIAEGGEDRKVGHFLKLTKTGAEGKPSEVSYIDMPETVESGKLDNENKKIVLTYSDGSKKDIDLAAIYEAIASKTVSVAETNTVKLNSAVDNATKAQTLSADVKLYADTSNAITKIDDIKDEKGEITTAGGLIVRKVEDLAAEGAQLSNLATGNAVVNALKNEKFAATAEQYGVIKLASDADAIAGTDSNKAITAASLKAALQSNIVGAVTYSGSTSTLTNAFPEGGVQKGDLFLVDTDVTLAGVELKKGDYILFKATVADVDSLTADTFDVIDNTEAEDIVRRDAEQTLTNKTIDADKNTISNLRMTNLADANASFATTETTDELKAAAKIASEAKVQEMIDAGVKSVAVDGVTIQNVDGTLSVKEGGLEVKHMKEDAVAAGTISADNALDTKLATEKAVRTLHDSIPAEKMTFTNKTFDANAEGNALSNVEVADFAAGVIVKAKGEGETGGIADVANADDAKLATEKAIAEALAAIKASATSAHTLTLDKAKWVMHADGDSATYTVTLSTDLGVSAEHKVSVAKLLDDRKNEVEGLIGYNTENGTVVFQINCTAAPEGWSALIVC